MATVSTEDFNDWALKSPNQKAKLLEDLTSVMQACSDVDEGESLEQSISGVVPDPLANPEE